jgi:tetratricopeptide (TPR) repeat protein
MSAPANLKQTAQTLQQAVRRNPQDVKAWYYLGLTRRALGQTAAAAAAWAQAVALNGEHADALFNLGRALADLDRGDDAIGMFQRLVALRPDWPDAHFNLGTALQAANRVGEARECFARTVTLQPEHVEAWLNLALCAGHLDDVATGIAAYRRVLALQPDHAQARNNLGRLLYQHERYAEAEACFRAALVGMPDNADIQRHLGDALWAQGKLAEAVAAYDAAIAADPDNVEAQINRAMTLLLMGDYVRGFAAYEARWREDGRPQARVPWPAWDGRSLQGCRLYLAPEQGVGDMVMFASLIPEVTAQGADVTLACDPRLTALFARSFPDIAVLPAKNPIYPPQPDTPVDAWTPIGSLAMSLRRSRADFPPHSGYLKPDPARVDDFRQRLAALPGRYKVGISWRGGTHDKAKRSMDLAQDWAALLQAPDVCFVNLQYGNCRTEVRNTAKALGVTLHAVPGLDPSDDLDGLAAMTAALDLVLSVANATAHLAGAVGAPGWVLVPAQAGWRWLAEGDDTPWYPSLRLIRQGRDESWRAVADRVAAELADRLSRRTTS